MVNVLAVLPGISDGLQLQLQLRLSQEQQLKLGMLVAAAVHAQFLDGHYCSMLHTVHKKAEPACCNDLFTCRPAIHMLADRRNTLFYHVHYSSFKHTSRDPDMQVQPNSVLLLLLLLLYFWFCKSSSPRAAAAAPGSSPGSSRRGS